MKLFPQHFRHARSAFTMVEIAICLAIISIALVAIIGVLPLGMNVQKDNREQTVVNQDATIFIEDIRNGSLGANDLTNYVYQIINYQTQYPAGTLNTLGYSNFISGTNIIGLLSTPEYLATDGSGNPIYDTSGGNYYSNHIVAYVRSMSGPAVEKPPQDNQLLQQDSFGYRILCVNAPVAMDGQSPSLYSSNLVANLHELRLTFLWPQLPNGNVGGGRQTFRALVAGQVATNIIAGNILYFYQPQSFVNSP